MLTREQFSALLAKWCHTPIPQWPQKVVLSMARCAEEMMRNGEPPPGMWTTEAQVLRRATEIKRAKTLKNSQRRIEKEFGKPPPKG